MEHKSFTQRGFTLIELLVVVSIIVILSLGILTVLYNARKESRDLARISDLQQIKLAVKLYKEANGSYPPTAGALGIGGTIDTTLQPFLPKVNRDPLSDGTGIGYVYLYNPNFTCTKTGQAVVYARQVENPTKFANFATVCTAATASNKITYKNAYIEPVSQ